MTTQKGEHHLKMEADIVNKPRKTKDCWQPLEGKTKVLQKESTLLAPSFWTSSLWNCEKINFCCFKRHWDNHGKRISEMTEPLCGFKPTYF